jgi:hypothetical protein
MVLDKTQAFISPVLFLKDCHKTERELANYPLNGQGYSDGRLATKKGILV